VGKVRGKWVILHRKRNRSSGISYSFATLKLFFIFQITFLNI
jgi:hypothetical protein